MVQYFKFSKILFAAILIATLPSCLNYFKATQAKAGSNIEKARSIDSLEAASRYFILRNGDKVFSMNNITISENSSSLECTLDTLAFCDQLYLTNGRKGHMRYKKNEAVDLPVLNEVHVFIDPDKAPTLGNYQLPLDKIKKIEVIEKDKKRTSNSYVAGGIGITLGVAAILFAAFAAAVSSMSFNIFGP